MMSEWLKVMLEEIARKQADDGQARIEQRRRHEEQAARLGAAAASPAVSSSTNPAADAGAG